MSRLTNSLSQLTIFLTLSGFVATPICAQPERSINFVFFLVDDMGWMDISPNNTGTFYDTPNIERLANSGMRFTQAYAACPVCSPTRVSIMTGQYPARLDTTDYFGAIQPSAARNRPNYNKPLIPAAYLNHMPLEQVTIAEALRDNGYATFFAGKWHMGGEGFLPEDQGFGINKGGHHRGSPPGGYFSPYKNPKLDDGPEGEHLTARLTDETIAFIESCEDSKQPFFAYLSYYAVHTPLQGPPDLVEKYRQRKGEMGDAGEIWGQEGARKVRLVQEHAVYAAMVESVDQSVGRILDTLDRLGLAENTAVIFFSDNGGLSTSEGHPTSNLPLRAGKGWLYEGGIREPCIIRWPGHTQPGSVENTPIISTDFYPTMLAMAGLDPSPAQHLDGINLSALLEQDGTIDRDAIYWHYPHYGNQGGSPGSAIRSGDWKLIHFYEDDRLELYNLAQDIGESRDLADAEPQRTAALKRALDAWRDEVGAKSPSRNSDK